jgi:aerobic-type carbon monoxide dehydrogenase small subunit (CoxS/CutS family)
MSCLMLTAQLDGCRVETVESLAPEGPLSPLQERFRQEHALQCGFCTPAFLMTATALAANGRTPAREQIREELAGVLCRCTGYEFIVNAVEAHLAAREGTRADD